MRGTEVSVALISLIATLIEMNPPSLECRPPEGFRSTPIHHGSFHLDHHEMYRHVELRVTVIG